MTNDQAPMTRQVMLLPTCHWSLGFGHWSFSSHLCVSVPLWFTCLLLALALAGCGGAGTTPVEGVVVLDGKPLANASVQFVPQGTGRDATGQTNQNGEFAMSTFQPRDGVLPGDYKVVISPPLGTPDPTQYATAEEAMSTASKAPAPKGSTFPQKYARPDQTPLKQTVPAPGKVKFELTSK